jgi:hypothetical protein
MSADSRVKDLEFFIVELSESDDYVRSKLDELKIKQSYFKSEDGNI